MSVQRPRNRAELDWAIERQFGADDGYANASAVIGAAVIARLLPEGVVKGGSALRLRYGESSTRFTTDVDVARKSTESMFYVALVRALRAGWEGFTGTVEQLPRRVPDEIQQRYAMQPYRVHLSYMGQSWSDLRLEVSHNELGDADSPDEVASDAITRLFEDVGLTPPGALPLMRLSYQMAQKLHAVSESGSQRAHDLVDLQVILHHDTLAFQDLRPVCERLFRYRKAQEWPVAITPSKRWEELYTESAAGLDVLPNVGDATAWANELVCQIAESPEGLVDHKAT